MTNPGVDNFQYHKVTFGIKMLKSGIYTAKIDI